MAVVTWEWTERPLFISNIPDTTLVQGKAKVNHHCLPYEPTGIKIRSIHSELVIHNQFIEFCHQSLQAVVKLE